MPTDIHQQAQRRLANGQVAKAPIQLNLTAAGWVVVAMMVVSVFISGTARIAIGFFVPLSAALIIDLYLSWLNLSRQSVSLLASRHTAESPAGIPLRVASTGGTRPVRVTMAFPGGEDHVVGLHDETETIQLRHRDSGATDFVRVNINCTVLGLSTAHRWQTHSMAMLHWAPAPETDRIPTPDALDEVARLREYVPGDRMSRVSWPVTARTGQMHVRASGVGHEEITLIVNPGPADPTHAGPARAMQLATTLASQLLEDGHQVRMVTTELDPEHRSALRQAAVNDPRSAPEVPAPTLTIVDQFLTDEQDVLRRIALAQPGPVITWPFPGAVNISSTGIESL